MTKYYCEKFLKFSSLISATFFTSLPSFACDNAQQIRLKVGGTQIDEWVGTSDTIRAVTLPNQFKLGVKIEETSREKYEDLMRRMKRDTVPAMVRISLYDLTADAPRLITRTWGGANGRQGYGPNGGADRVDEVGKPGVVFTLAKLNCADQTQKLEISAAALTALPTAADLKQSDDKPQMSQANLQGSAAATADIAAGIYRISYPDAMLSQMPAREKEIMQRLFKEIGIDVVAESGLFATQDASVAKGYMLTMMKAIETKFGREKLRSVEAKMKVALAER